jgi:hypothetical protein
VRFLIVLLIGMAGCVATLPSDPTVSADLACEAARAIVQLRAVRQPTPDHKPKPGDCAQTVTAVAMWAMAQSRQSASHATAAERCWPALTGGANNDAGRSQGACVEKPGATQVARRQRLRLTC